MVSQWSCGGNGVSKWSLETRGGARKRNNDRENGLSQLPDKALTIRDTDSDTFLADEYFDGGSKLFCVETTGRPDPVFGSALCSWVFSDPPELQGQFWPRSHSPSQLAVSFFVAGEGGGLQLHADVSHRNGAHREDV